MLGFLRALPWCEKNARFCISCAVGNINIELGGKGGGRVSKYGLGQAGVYFAPTGIRNIALPEWFVAFFGSDSPFCKTLGSAYGFGLKEFVVLPERIYQESLVDKIHDLLTLAPRLGGVNRFTEPDGYRFLYLFDTSKIEEKFGRI